MIEFRDFCMCDVSCESNPGFNTELTVSDKLTPVLEILSNSDTGSVYYIPSYQRCYRWTKENVLDMLNDFINFYDEKHDEMYCLQPLTLKDGDGKLIVIDGQQRLTTLYILIASLYRKVGFACVDPQDLKNIVYGGRKNTQEYLEALLWKNPDGVGKTKEEIDSDFKANLKWNRDIACMSNSFDVFAEFFKEYGKANKISELLKDNRIGFIKQVYSKKSNTEIDLFNGINVGRIELTDAELIRAKLLKIMGEEASDIAKKWDEIEHFLQNNKMWYFLSNENNKDASRILYIFNVIRGQITHDLLLDRFVMNFVRKNEFKKDKVYKNEDKGYWANLYIKSISCVLKSTYVIPTSCLELLLEKIKNLKADDVDESLPLLEGILNVLTDDVYKAVEKRHETYRFFQKYAINEEFSFLEKSIFDKESIATFWNRVVSIYDTFNKWYCDIELFNYIGLVLTDKNKEFAARKTITVNELYNVYHSEETKNRSDFLDYLKSEILYSFDDRDITNIWPYTEKQDDKDNDRIVNALFHMPDNMGLSDDQSDALNKLRDESTESKKSKKRIIRVIDNTDKFPLKNVEVEIDGVSMNDSTNEFGEFDFSDCKENVNISLGKIQGYKEANSKFVKQTENIVEFSLDKDESAKDEVDYKTTVFKSITYSGRKNDTDEHRNRERCHKFLLWSNCEMLNLQRRNCSSQDLDVNFDMYRFPFDSYKTDGPDVEHVDSFVSMQEETDFYKDVAEQRFFLECLVPLLEKEDDLQTVNDWADAVSVDDKKELIKNLIDSFYGSNEFLSKGSSKVDELEKTFIDRRKVANLTLLDKNINRGYKNFPFNIKRQDIVRKGQRGIYVYPCTKMVFMKEFNPYSAELSTWGENDFYNYWRFLLRMFIYCFCYLPSNDGNDVKESHDYFDDVLSVSCYRDEILMRTDNLIKVRKKEYEAVKNMMKKKSDDILTKCSGEKEADK